MPKFADENSTKIYHINFQKFDIFSLYLYEIFRNLISPLLIYWAIFSSSANSFYIAGINYPQVNLIYNSKSIMKLGCTTKECEKIIPETFLIIDEHLSHKRRTDLRKDGITNRRPGIEIQIQIFNPLASA